MECGVENKILILWSCFYGTHRNIEGSGNLVNLENNFILQKKLLNFTTAIFAVVIFGPKFSITRITVNFKDYGTFRTHTKCAHKFVCITFCVYILPKNRNIFKVNICP